MSVHRFRVQLSDAAQEDYEDILVFTLRRWGTRQKDRYKAALDEAFARLGDYPEIGQPTAGLPSGYRERPVEQHVLYYRSEDDIVWIKRILHSRQQVTSELLE